MLQRRDFLQVSLAASVVAVLPNLGFGQEKPKKIKMLMVTQSLTYVHDSVKRPENQLSPAEIAVTQLAQQSGLFEVHCTQDAAADFTKENLQNYDLVFFYTTGKLPIKDADLDYFFKEWLPTKGHGVIGAHSATDTYGDYQPYWDMIGGTFDGHPWGSGNTVTITVHEPQHPAVKMWGNEFQIKDEIYQYKHWQPEKVRVLMSLNMEKCNPKGDRHVPVSWVKQYGEGKVFYTNLGHNPETWANKTFVKHLEGGIRWVLGLESGEVAPNPELSKAEEAKVKALQSK
ncbi:MAG: ThuA domain-containing protein [Planctomycetota bacterium]